jgi:hypothetical protein
MVLSPNFCAVAFSMTISLAHPEDFGIRAELLTGLDRLSLGSTCMSNGS